MTAAHARAYAPRSLTRTGRRRRAAAGATALALGLAGAVVLLPTAGAAADEPDRSPALVGSLQTELGCADDWAPACTQTELAPTATPGLYAAELELTPEGDAPFAYEYKVALNDSWDENYGADGAAGGANIPLVVGGATRLRVVYDDTTHRVAIQPLELAGAYTAADDALVAAPVCQPGSTEQFYFVMTDRFENADPGNDTGGLVGDRLVTGFDPTDKGFYNGGDLAGLRAQLPYIEGLGTTAIWLTPSFKNRPVQAAGTPDVSAGYHGYWITDFTQIDPHLGTNAELEALIDDAHDRGIKVYFDIITNHTADVIDYTEGQYSYIDQATSPYYLADGVTTFDPADYAGTGDFPELSAENSFPYTPVVAAGDEDVKVPAWLNDVTLYHNRGNSTYSGESTTFGDFSGLDDLMTENQVVVDGFVDVYQAWIDLGIDGFRIDTVKHVNFEFWEDWTTRVLDYAHAHGKPDFFMFGEVYDADPAKLSPYVRRTDMNSVLDFTFQSAASRFARGFEPATLSELFAGDDMYTTPTTSASALPTFLGNHDMGRIGYFVAPRGDGVERSALAHSLMYLTRGQPVVYYGDEQGFVGLGGDKSARQTLFASQVAEFTEQPLLSGEAVGSVDRFDTDAPLYEHIAALAALRESTPALESGAQIERPVSGAGEDSVYAFSRVLRDDKIEHLVALNNAASAATVTVDTLTPGAQFTSLLGGHAAVTADADGAVSLTVPAFSAVVLVADEPVAAGAGDIAVDLPTPGARLAGVSPVRADVADAWSETSFAYRLVGSDEWIPLGTAETTTPRVFHDVAGLAAGTLVEYRAVSVDAAGTTVAASTYGSVGVAVDGTVPEDPEEPGPTPGRTDLTVTIPGTLDTELGCTNDWEPACTAIRLPHVGNGVYSGTFTIPAGDWQYKIAINGTWDENYGAGGEPGGANVSFSLASEQAVTFVYDDATKWFTSSAQGPLITLPGSYQDAVGCPANWAPDCVVTSLQDKDGDGTYTYTASAIPAGSYEVKVAHNLDWTENYGDGGAPGGPNIAFNAPGGKPVTFTYVLATHLLTIEVTDPPLPGLGQQQAHWVDAGTIAWPADLAGGADGADLAGLTWRLHHAPDASLEVADGAVEGGEATELTARAGGLTDAQLERFPQLAGYVALTLPDDTDRADVEAWLRGELMVGQYEGAGEDAELSAVTGVQVPGVLDDLWAADAADRALGATWGRGGKPTLAVWAPTAQEVALLRWPDARGSVDLEAEPVRHAMERQDDGSWTVTGARSWKDDAYLYEVTVYAPSTDAVEVNRVTDPSSVALTVNSTHSVLVDLDDRALQPREWRFARQPDVDPVDQTIYELHVRDFSINDATVPAERRGTYLAFAERRSDGREHLRDLADAGLTTVHLLPTFDIATIEEDRGAQATPPCDLASFPPDSPEQQACIGEIRDADGYNWGYDPLHWSAPEGSYAVNPHGGARVAEFRTMVGALHADGLQVVLDEVFNHTSASGQAPASILDRVVPGYYHRLNAVGAVETSTCCQNIATEHAMAEKMMVDSVVTWARDYKVDGFRFDLMGHHSRETMLAVREALDELDRHRDGVDGESVYLYGEGWNFGEVADNRLFTQATQGQLGGTGIGTFSDRLRDAVRGGGPFDEDPRIQGFGSGAYVDPNGAAVNGDEAAQLARAQHAADLVRLGLAGNLREFEFLTSAGVVQSGAELDYNGQPAGYAESPEEVITYVDAHDNETLWDALTLKLPTDTPMDERVRMNTLSLATTALAQTPSFWHAGADLLRSKSLDRNSYNSGDWFNTLDWTGADNGFGHGLPPAADNEAKWPFQQPLLADPALRPTADDVATAADGAQDLLRLRFSTDLFRLGDAALIEQKVSFPASGPDADPGVVVMRIDDTVGRDVDRRLDGVLVVFNATPDEASVPIAELAGDRYVLSPVQARGSDDVVRDTAWDRATGTVTVPARTVAVLVDDQHRSGWTWPWEGGWHWPWS